jgi:hypothetical protein
LKLTDDISVTGHVLLKFCLPEFDTALGVICKPAVLMAMPEAAMDKHHSPVFRKNNVRSPRKASDMNPEAESHAVEK